MFGNQRRVNRSGSPTLHLIKSRSSFAYVEAYKSLRTNLIYAAESGGSAAKVIMVTSSIPNEGKTTVSINLAASLAQVGKRVVLLDCDLRKGSISRYLHMSKQASGLATFLSEKELESGAVNKMLLRWESLGISILPSGFVPANPSELLGSDRMRAVLKSLGTHYDYVICDSAPVVPVTDSLALGRYVDGAVLVVAQDIVTREMALSAKRQLEHINVPILGVVFNQYDSKKAGRKFART